MKVAPAVVAVIPAAGIGSRMQADIPKQYLSLHNKTILEHTVDHILAHPAIEHVILALNPEDDMFPTLALASNPNVTAVTGGNERADSVLNALREAQGFEWALVHDAARPCVQHQDITTLLSVIDNENVAGGILATPVRDTMKRANPPSSVNKVSTTSTVSHTESRDNLWHALTPQLFPVKLLTEALERSLAEGVAITDEASAIEWAKEKVALIDSDPINIKITHPADLPLAGFYLQQRNKASSCE